METGQAQGIDMIYRFAPDGTYRYMNKKAAEFLGKSPEEMVGRHYLEFVHDDQKKETARFYQQQIENRQPSTYYEFQVPVGDGNYRWVGQSIELVCEGNKLIELLGVARDITEQKETQKHLALSDFRLMALINNMDAAILVENENRELQFVNQKFCDFFGIPAKPEDLVGMDCAAAAEQSKALFEEPSAFIHGITEDLKHKRNHSGVRLRLKDERVFERDYVPIFNRDLYAGHMWLYRDVTIRSLSEQAIIESEKKYREVIQNIDLGLLEVDNEEHILYANQAFLDATGFSLKEIQGRDAKEVFLNTEDRAYYEDHLKKIAGLREQDLSSAYELPIRAKNGERLWFLISGTAIKDFEGKVIGSLGIHHNITGIKKLQSQLEYRNNLQETLLRLAGELINLDESEESRVINDSLAQIGSFVQADRAYIFDYDFRSNITNNSYEWCAEGISPEIDNLQGVPLEAIPEWPETHQRGEAMIYEDVAALEKTDPIREILEPQGIQSIITVPIFGRKQLYGFIGFDAVKIKKNWTQTEIELLTFLAQLLQAHYARKLAESRLVEAELTQRTILRSALDAVVIIDSNGLVRFWNSHAEEIFGHEESTTIGKSLSGIIIPEKFREAHERGMAHFMETGEGPVLNQRIELVAVHSSGKSFPVELSIIPVKVGDDYIFASFLRDITARKKAEDDMNTALEQQKELARMKSRLISMASHEFRTPLTTIKANAEMLEIWAERLPEKGGEKAQKYFGRLNREIERLSNIMTDILIMGRLDSGKIKVKPRSIDLYSYILEYIDRHHASRNDGRELQVKLKGAPKFMAIDPEIFDHILNNLVNNAFKYSPNKADPLITLNYSTDNLKLSVEDHGIGIPEEDLDKIFSSFFRSENTKGIEGSGMGLAVVKQMADMHGFEMKVFSALNQGTEFVLEIPYKENDGTA